MKVEEGEAAYKFLFKNVQNAEGYEATKKLQSFIKKELATRDGKHSPLFLEEHDCGDVNKPRQELKISDIYAKLSDYEKANNLAVEPVNDSSESVKKEPPTEEELWENLHRFGVA